MEGIAPWRTVDVPLDLGDDRLSRAVVALLRRLQGRMALPAGPALIDGLHPFWE